MIQYGIKEIKTDIRRVELQMQEPNTIFVFGSNELGIHGAGAARVAREQYGAVFGRGVGLYGRSYALPTVSTPGVQLAKGDVKVYVDELLVFAKNHPELSFIVTRVGCGLAGFTDDDIAPMFANAPENCYLPEGWRTCDCMDCVINGEQTH
jgi:hypothetical protein